MTAAIILAKWVMIEVLRKTLDEAGIRSQALKSGVLVISEAGERYRFRVVQRQRPPRPSDIPALKPKATIADPSLLLSSYVSESSGRALTDADWSWADACGNWDIRAPGLRLQRRVQSSPPEMAHTPIPKAGRGLAVLRWLIQLPDASVSPTELAARANISQPGVSKVLKRLEREELIEHPSRFEWRVHREQILEQFLESYRGPRGEAEYFYSLDSPNDAAAKLFQTLDKHETVFVSGDVAADLLAPYRRPETLVVYRTSVWKKMRCDWVKASSRNDANIVVISSRDDSVFAVPRQRDFKQTTLVTVDATQVIWDLVNEGGDDRIEAAEVLKQWLLSNLLDD